MRMSRASLLSLTLACPLALAPAAYAAAPAQAAPAGNLTPAVREAPLPSPLPALVPVQINGPEASRIDLLFVGDGYTKAELPKFHQDVLKQWAAMTALEPYRTYQKFFNVWELDLASPDSGVTNDPTMGVAKNTVLNMHYWCHGIERLLCVDDSRSAALEKQLPNADVIFAIANSTLYGGAGGPVITVAGSNVQSDQITPHEAAHTIGKLADEYGGYGAATDVSEPDAPNVTTETAAQMAAAKNKWWRWLGATSPDGSKIDAYPGGNYYDSGYYRPSLDSNMRTLGQPFNQPSAEALIENFYNTVTPIDSSNPDQTIYLGRKSKVTISTPQLVGHDFQIYWAVNGTSISQGYGSRTLDLSTVSVPKGKATLTAVVRDTTDAVRDEDYRNSKMTKTYTWQIKP